MLTVWLAGTLLCPRLRGEDLPPLGAAEGLNLERIGEWVHRGKERHAEFLKPGVILKSLSHFVRDRNRIVRHVEEVADVADGDFKFFFFLFLGIFSFFRLGFVFLFLDFLAFFS